MSGWIVAVLALAAVVPVAVAGWSAPRSLVPPGLAVALLGVAAVVAAMTAEHAAGPAWRVTAVVVGALAAIAGGGTVTTAVFALVDGPRGDAARSVTGAGEVLRGGAWIGALERAAVLALLLAGWPDGLLVLLGLKGLGRYPELRARESSGAAERFIIGTFTSVLWAAACAGVVALLR